MRTEFMFWLDCNFFPFSNLDIPWSISNFFFHLMDIMHEGAIRTWFFDFIEISGKWTYSGVAYEIYKIWNCQIENK